MASFVLELKRQIGRDVFTDTELKALLGGSPESRYGKVKRALERGEMIRIKRGLYCLASHLRQGEINLFSVAQYIHGPSYVSLESALSSHELIPEAVYTTTCASSKRAKEFDTPLGVFLYRRVVCSPFFVGVQRHREGRHVYFVADPWKALADYVYVYKKNWLGLTPLIESLRIDPDLIRSHPRKTLPEIRASFSSRRVQAFLKSLEKELGS